MRYDKLATNDFAFVQLASISVSLGADESTSWFLYLSVIPGNRAAMNCRTQLRT